MQGTTRSVEAVEGVAVAKAMASDGTVSPSASPDGNSSVVVNTGGGCRSHKRKGFLGRHSATISSNLGQKKKLCSGTSSTNEMAKVVEAVISRSGLVAMKKKERIDDTIVGDPSLEDAARALTEFSFLAHKPVLACPALCLTKSSTGHQSIIPSPPKPKPSTCYQSVIPAVPSWKRKKFRSGRTKRLESSSNEDSRLAVVSDSSNLSPLPLEKQEPQQQQVSECSCSPGGDSQSVITLVKVEDDPPCSSTGVEEEEQVEQKKVDVVVEEHEENNISRCPSDPARLPKLASVSSIESLQADSRAESPSSPLPPVLRTGEFVSIVPKSEGSSPIGRSAFQRVVPIRPVKKPALSRKLKVEEKTFEDLNPEQAAVKHLSRKKPRPTGFVPLQQQQQQQQQQEQQQQQVQQPQQQLAPVKIEEGDVCALALGPPRLSEAEEAELKRIGVASSIALPGAVVVDEKTVKLDPALVKVETKPPGKPGHRATSKAKPALSEGEKEARKQRRVQANRESARLTIRKKQVLCEELTRKAEFLTIENAAFREDVARIREKNESIIEMNAKLREQVAKSAGKHEPESSSPAPSSSTEKPPDGMVQYQFPPQFGGLPMAPQYIWAFAMAQAQAAQAAGVSPGEINMGSAEYTALCAAAAAAACGNSCQAGFWSMASSSQGQSSMLPPFYPGHLPGASVASSLPSSCGAPATVSRITRSVSLPVVPTDGSFSVVTCERSLLSGKPVASYRSGDFVDSVHDVKRNATKQDSTHLGSGFSGRTHYYQMSSISHAGTAVTGVGTMAPRKAGEGSYLPMPNASGQLLSRSHSLSTPHVPKLHARYPVFGSGGMSMTREQLSARETEAQRKGAAATEARRKRIELKRTKSFLNRQQQASRAAEPSA